MNTKFYEHQGGQIAYEETGSGPLVISVPSMGDLRGEYRFLAPRLASAGYRVVSMDIRGHGETSTNWQDVSVAAIGADILALIRHLNAGPAVIAGTSMAAGAAVWAAAEAPNLVSGLVLLGPVVRGESGFFFKLLMRVLFQRPWGAGAWIKYFETLFPSQKPADYAEYTAALRRNLEEPGRLETLRRMMLASKQASAERVERVQAPALVVMGSKDPDFKDPRAEAEWLAQTLHGRCEVIDGAGHYPHVEMLDRSIPLVLSFLASIKAGQAVTHAA